MLLIISCPIVLLLCSRYNTFVTDYLLNYVLLFIPQICKFKLYWFNGIYELNWIVSQWSPAYSAIVVLGFSVKKTSKHFEWIINSCYQYLAAHPVINLTFACENLELAWIKTITFNTLDIGNALYNIMGKSISIISN